MLLVHSNGQWTENSDLDPVSFLHVPTVPDQHGPAIRLFPEQP